MLFTFKRDDEGRERIYVGDVCVAEMHHQYGPQWLGSVLGLMEHHVHDAIERADEAGFWNYNSDDIARARQQIQAGDYCAEELFGVGGWSNVINEVTVDVPVADNDVRSVTRVSAEDA